MAAEQRLEETVGNTFEANFGCFFAGWWTF
jgi:hypothetical protein